MPFQTKRFDELPPEKQGENWDPDVQIFFHGQLILRSPDGQGCDVAFNPIATDHVLTIEVRIKKEGTDLIRMRHLGPLNFRNSEAMLIEVRGGGAAAVPPAAFRLVARDEPINMEDKDSAPSDDFRWILNVEGPRFHNRLLNFPGFASQNVIRLRRGEYYFKTAAHPSNRLVYHRSGGGQPDATFDTIGSVASASVFLAPNQTLMMKWRDGTRDEDRVLRLEQDDNTRYEIYIENTPLFLDTPSEPELPGLDEFVHYYKILDVDETERFSLVPQMRPNIGNLGTPDVPCQVLTENGPGGG